MNPEINCRVKILDEKTDPNCKAVEHLHKRNSKYKRVEGYILSGRLTVSEISDEMCRSLLHRIIQRHRIPLQQWEAQKRQQENLTPKIEVIREKFDLIPQEK